MSALSDDLQTEVERLEKAVGEQTEMVRHWKNRDRTERRRLAQAREQRDTAKARIDALVAENERLREALAPFAAEFVNGFQMPSEDEREDWMEEHDDSDLLHLFMGTLTVGDVRRAAELLTDNNQEADK